MRIQPLRNSREKGCQVTLSSVASDQVTCPSSVKIFKQLVFRNYWVSSIQFQMQPLGKGDFFTFCPGPIMPVCGKNNKKSSSLEPLGQLP